MKKLYSVFILFIIVLFSCSHINELANYNLVGKKVLLKQQVNPSASDVKVLFNYDFFNKNLLEVVIKGIGSGYVESEIQEKLQKALNKDSISNSISWGLQEGLQTYCNTVNVSTLDSNPDFILESIFEKFRLKSDSYGVYASISTRGRLIDRASAKLIWQNDETYILPLGFTTFYYSGDKKITTTTGIINAARLLQMTEEEIRVSVEVVAKEVGMRQSEQLRYDISESKTL
ncbi:MAG: hypothetical protein JW917_03335 [Ignavibacteria bacterium]|nr:hypothetical protein [Ignavibacteria bacterium]